MNSQETNKIEAQDIFLRAHTVPSQKTRNSPHNGLTRPELALIFDTETTLDARQQLTFGAYRICRRQDGRYLCLEEGVVYADNLASHERYFLNAYIRKNFADIETKSFPPRLKLNLYSCSDFVEKVFWKVIKQGGMVVGFNLPFDLSRLAVDWDPSRKGGWSLVLSLRCSRKNGRMEPNPERPRIRVVAKNSKTAFIRLTRTAHPEEWPNEAPFVDLHTVGWSLHSKSYSLNTACEAFKVPGKLNHLPSGHVTADEIDYCRQDVRSTTALLNAMCREFDRHPIDLRLDHAYSPASVAKAYLDAMGIIPPKEKFEVPDHIYGIAMQSYYGGRAECRIRHTPVPIVLTDFSSQYPGVNALLRNWRVLTAKSMSFPDTTDEVRRLLSRRDLLREAFTPDFWKQLSFFALIRPDHDIFPVRSVYNKVTQNIGVNYLTSEQPIWFAGPDVIASVLLTGKTPNVLRAIRMVPHGCQAGLHTKKLQGMVPIDPRTDDFFTHVVEQRKRYKPDKSLAYFLKILANAGSYGLFVEVSPERQSQATNVEVFSGEESFSQPSDVIEKPGRWYFPPIASLITAGGRLLLAMLERCVADAGGSYLFCDTDSLCIVSAEKGGLIPCPGGPHKLRSGENAVKALSWKEVKHITDRFRGLNPYDPRMVPDFLKIEDVNHIDCDPAKPRRQLYGFAVSAKRYSLFEKSGRGVAIIAPKAHGLGYLYPPKHANKGEMGWIAEAWEWLLRVALALPNKAPSWLDSPAVMRVVISTPHVLNNLKDNSLRPFNFVFLPMVSLTGYPANVDPNKFRLIAPFRSNPNELFQLECINAYDGKRYQLALEQGSQLTKVIPQTLGYVLRLYLRHPESKSLAPDGAACDADTRGLLGRAHILAGAQRYIGKETDRRWEQGEDPSLLAFTALEYRRSGNMVSADARFLEQLGKFGMRELMRRTGLSQHTIEAVRHGQPVRRATFGRICAVLNV